LSKLRKSPSFLLEFIAHPVYMNRGAVSVRSVLVAHSGVILTALWFTVISTEVGKWRVVDGTKTGAELIEP
jgi:hypothetical protein